MSRALPSLLVAALVASVSGGCAASPAAQAVAAALAEVASEPAPTVSAPTPQSKSKAITVAQHYARMHGWPATQVLGATFENGMWIVSIRRLPKMPGGEATVNVSLEGELLDYSPGS